MPTGAEWEREVASYLRSHGYDAQVRKTIQSHEIDVYATRGGERLVVECKAWNQAVTKDPVRTVHNNALDLKADPGLAYTSDLTSGARELAQDYELLLLPAEVVRGEQPTIEDIRQLIETYPISLPEVSSLDRLDEPLGPFTVDAQFPDQVAEAAANHSFAVSASDVDALADQIRQEVLDRMGQRSVPILREDRGQLDLYFVGETTHPVLPDWIEKMTIPLT